MYDAKPMVTTSKALEPTRLNRQVLEHRCSSGTDQNRRILVHALSGWPQSHLKHFLQIQKYHCPLQNYENPGIEGRDYAGNSQTALDVWVWRFHFV